jgi:Cu/Ag efflux protein CusF
MQFMSTAFFTVARVTVVCCIAAILGVGRSEPANNGSAIVIHATVLSVDPAHMTTRIHHAALETMPAADRTCRVRDASRMKNLRRGDTIEAVADTMHSPWMLDRITIVRK